MKKYTEDIDEILASLTSVDETYQQKTNKMKSTIFTNKQIKPIKFSKANLSDLEFGDIRPLLQIKDGAEAHVGAYSTNEFFAYRYLKVHNKYPDLMSFRKVKTAQFVEKLFTNADIPIISYMKAIENDGDEIDVDTFMIAIKHSQTSMMYLFCNYDEVILFYDKEYEKNEVGSFQKIIGLIKGCSEPKQAKNRIFVVYQGQNGFEKTGFDIKKVDVNLKGNYKDDFEKVSKEIVKGLNDKNKTNLVMLSGDPGTGKTSYLRYLTSKLTKNIIFISPDMVNHITDPSFIPFLMKNDDSILIIEDAEPAMESRGGSGRSGAVSNILNLTDGLLSDCLNISIVATFNTSSKNIDPALLRKGRLLKNYKFEKLSVIKSKILLKKLGNENTDVKMPMTLADIYFKGDDNNNVELKTKTVGFGNR